MWIWPELVAPPAMTDTIRIVGAGTPAARNVLCSLMPISGSAPDPNQAEVRDRPLTTV